MNTTAKTASNLEYLASGLSQLSPQEWERLELLLDKSFARKILRRGKGAYQSYRTGKTVSLVELKREF